MFGLLDILDGDPDLEDNGDAEPSLGAAARYGDGKLEYDLEEDPAEMGIADFDALNLAMQETSLSGGSGFNGEGHHIGRKLLRDYVEDPRSSPRRLDATRVSPGYGRYI
jgi:hypothetical protein